MQVKVSAIKIPKRKRDINIAKVQEIARSIKTIGLLHPISITKGRELLAGAHRLEAYKTLGYDEIPVVIKNEDSIRHELIEIDENLCRSELTVIEAGDFLVRRDELLQELGLRAKSGRPKKGENNSPFLTTAQIAKEAGLSERVAQMRKQISKGLTDTAKDLIKTAPIGNNAGELLKLSKLEDKQQVRIAKIISKNPSCTLRQAVKRVHATSKKPESLAGKGKYSIILADPPWEYEGQMGGGLPYPDMSLEEIKALPVADIAQKNSALFLWVTFPMIAKGLEVISAWGFEYKTAAFVWIKTNKKDGMPFRGIGNYTKSNAEVCLLGIRGRVVPVSDSVSSIVITERGKHSEKPEVVRERIVELFGAVNRIELFARKASEGWESWGKDFNIEIPRIKS